MGSVTYDFLADSLFFHQDSLDNVFKNESPKRLEKELQKYREHCLKNNNELIKEIQDTKFLLKVFSSIEETSIDLLKQTALYIDQFIVSDPLFKMTELPSNISKASTKYLGYQEHSLDKYSLAKASSFLKNITPMVASDFVKIYPLSYHFEAPVEIKINSPNDYFNNILPKEILDFFKENALVKSLIKISGEDGWRVEDTLYPCRGIVIDFKDSDFKSSMIYHLFEAVVTDVDKKNGKVTFRETLPDKPPSLDHFNNWVSQSINSASKAFFDRVFKEIFISSNLNSTYLCDNRFTSDLISKLFPLKETIQTYTANKIINFELPFIDDIDIQKLMDIRVFEADVFTNFRLELEKQFRELRVINDTRVLELKIQNIFHELNEVQVPKINKKVTHIKKQLGLNSLIALGGLMGSIQTSGISLLATAIALGKGFKDYNSYKETITDNPAYLLWKVKRK
jgi:hypothetical protein